MPQILLIVVKYVIIDIFLSPFNFACVSSKYVANLAASDVTLTTCAIQTTDQILANFNCWVLIHK